MFYEKDDLNNKLNCIKCNQRLDEPRILPCGETICAYCYISIEANKNKFVCFVCNENHSLTENGLPINKILLKILALESKEVYRGNEVKQLKGYLDDIQEDINKISFCLNNGVDRIKDFCFDLKNKVQLRTEEAIEQLNEHNQDMITEIEEFERFCIKSYQVNLNTNDEVRKTKKELEEFNLKWNQYLKQTVICDKKISEAIAKASELGMKTKKDFANLDKFIFNGSQMKFERNENELDRSVLGSLMKQLYICESAILSNGQMTELMSLCSFKFPLNQKWKLIYRATRDGFGSADFHSKCDSYQNSLVIIKSTNGNVFGGYTKQNWSGDCVFKADPNAFLFSFINQHNKKIVMKCTHHSKAIDAYCAYGPSFGADEHDLHICDNSNAKKLSYSDLGYSYNHPNYAYESNEARSFLAGSFYFLTTEIEVYTKE
jgi:hypothetical protein